MKHDSLFLSPLSIGSGGVRATVLYKSWDLSDCLSSGESCEQMHAVGTANVPLTGPADMYTWTYIRVVVSWGEVSGWSYTFGTYIGFSFDRAGLDPVLVDLVYL